ncbi:MAG: VOC family protein [Bacteroidetes bacterium]|nr:VOC family protein [Bacteroidota bacterium]
MANAISWFEIPVNEMDRARAFYEKAFDIKMEMLELPNITFALFPAAPHEVGGALCIAKSYVPSLAGTLPYLNANPDLQAVLDRTEQAGGKVLLSKTHISDERGYMGLIMDTEGNRIGLHSRS